MNLLGSNLPVSRPLYKILFSLKFETGSYFLKFIKKFCTLWANKRSQNSGSSLETLGALLLQLQYWYIGFA